MHDGPEPFDLTRTSPDAAHEAIRVAVVQAIEDLDYTTGDLSISLELVDVLFVLIDQLLTDNAALTARIEALEQAEEPPVAD